MQHLSEERKKWARKIILNPYAMVSAFMSLLLVMAFVPQSEIMVSTSEGFVRYMTLSAIVLIKIAVCLFLSLAISLTLQCAVGAAKQIQPRR